MQNHATDGKDVLAARKDLNRIGGPLQELLTKLHLVKPMVGWQAVSLWPDVVGERVAERSKAVAFRDGILIVDVASPSWMTELSYLKRRIVKDLNRQIGENVVQDIQLRPAMGSNRPGTERKRDS